MKIVAIILKIEFIFAPMLKKLFLSLLFVTLLLDAFAQQAEDEKDSLFFESSDVSNRYVQFQPIDLNPVNSLQLYRPIGAPRLPLARSSNIGLPLYSYIAGPQRWSLHYLQGGYQAYNLTADSLKYYKVSRPITRLNYTNGAQKEQYFSVLHSQNLGEGLNIAFRYDRVNSEGFFVRQLANHTRFHTTYNLHSKSKRFESRGYYTVSNFEAHENGGIFIDSVNQETNNPALLGVNLFTAQNRSRAQEWGMYNSYKVHHFSEDLAKGFVSVYHQLKWERSWRNFEAQIDPANDIFDSFYLDSTQTNDSSFAEVYRNTIGFQLDENFYIGFRQSNFHYFQNFLSNTDFQSQHLMAGWNDSLLNHQWKVDFAKGLSGYHQDEVKLHVSVSSRINTIYYSLSAQSEKNVVDYFMTRQRSNQQYFDKRFDATSYLSTSLQVFEMKSGIGLKLQFQSHGNFIYFDKNGMITQSSESVNVISARASKKFSFLRNFRLLNMLYWQSISNENILPLPSFISYHSLYYENRFFNEALHLQVGADAYVISEYSGYAYAPESSQFYLNSSNRKLGNIQQLDLFVNFGITDNGRLFVKMENVLNPNYAQSTERIYQYPVPGRALKFGLSWRMIN